MLIYHEQITVCYTKDEICVLKRLIQLISTLSCKNNVFEIKLKSAADPFLHPGHDLKTHFIKRSLARACPYRIPPGLQIYLTQCMY